MLDREKFNNSRIRLTGAVLGIAGAHYISELTSNHVGNAAAKLLPRWLPAPYSGLVRTGIVMATYVCAYRTIDKKLEKDVANYLDS